MTAIRQPRLRILSLLTIVCLTTLPTFAAPAKSKSTGEAAPAAAKTDIVAAAKKIDDLVSAAYAEHKVKPQPVVSDLVFMRRAYLDIAGRIPTAEEAKAFLASKDRKKLVDKLLDSEAYTENYFNFWADLLRIKTRLTNNVNGGPYIQYVKDFIRTNKPYDKFVYQLITAEGRVFDDGAAGYMLRDTGMPLDNMAVTVRVFLGTSIGCAQCHDHPFDKWTQLEFYEMSAYTYGLEYREKGMVNQRELYKAADNQKLPTRVDQVVRRLIRENSQGLHDNVKREIKLPDDYKYDDAKPGQVVQPMTIFGSEAKADASTTPRQAFAKWLTSRENPRFALTIANRLWKKVMGLGLYEPVDEITDKSKPTNPELMKHLTDQMLAMNFSVKDYLKMLYYTETYQRGTLKADLGPEESFVYQGRQLRRMSAEQIWDSFATLVGGAAIDDPGSEGDRDYDAIDIKGKSAAEIIALAKDMAENPGKFRNTGKNAGKGKKAAPATPGNIQRAAMISSPAPAGHFLREFGQSDREQVDGYNTNPSITQVLQLLNGQIDGSLLNKNSYLMKQLDAAKTPQAKVDLIFTSVLGRSATSEEARMALGEISRNNDKGVGNVIWALLNTREFMFVQ
jgi:hypothetical protein